MVASSILRKNDIFFAFWAKNMAKNAQNLQFWEVIQANWATISLKLLHIVAKLSIQQTFNPRNITFCLVWLTHANLNRKWLNSEGAKFHWFLTLKLPFFSPGEEKT